MSDGSTTPENTPTDAAVPPPPETPIPEGLIPPEPEIPAPSTVVPPPSEIPTADAVVPPPPPEVAPPMTRSSRRTPPILQGEQPSAVADDWAEPSVAPAAPSTGGYRALTAVIFGLLVLLLVAAVVLVVYLLTNTTLELPSVAGAMADLA